MNTIKNISVNTILNSENNPRKAMGDLTELRDSIAKNGILQPITVVKIDEGYRVIMGHRRLEAAKQAGLEEVPCIIEKWDDNKQLDVMMMENMLREQLTTYEEAKGFQMMMDLGKSVEEIAEQTGFSQTTVRNRTKLLSLDEKKFKESVERGATLEDLTKLYEIEDEHVRNAVLTKAGTKDFQSKLQSAIEKEKQAKKMSEGETAIGAWAKKIDKANMVDGEPVKMYFVGSYSYWSDKIPEKPELDTRFFYTIDDYRISIYAEGENTREAEEKERRARERQIEMELDSAAMSAYNLRLTYIRNFGNFKKYGKVIMREMMRNAIQDMARNSWRSYDLNDLGYVLGIEDLPNNLEKLNDFTMEKVALAMLMVYNDKETACTWRSSWQKDGYHYYYEANEQLMEWYGFLMSIGYQMSTEETDFINGNVEHVEKKEEAVA